MRTPISALLLVCTLIFSTTAMAADTAQLDQARTQFVSAFNDRNWEAAAGLIADDAVFHRMNADTLQSGSEQIMSLFKDTIGGEWNVKFAHLDNMDWMAGTGDNTNTVDAGHFAVTAGADSDSCYAGFYLIPWNKDMNVPVVTWQDAQVDLGTCQ
jgi:hypothetical protein